MDVSEEIWEVEGVEVEGLNIGGIEVVGVEDELEVESALFSWTVDYPYGHNLLV